MLQAGALPTKVVSLTQVVSADELRDDEEYEDIVEDMRSEGGKYGEYYRKKPYKPCFALYNCFVWYHSRLRGCLISLTAYDVCIGPDAGVIICVGCFCNDFCGCPACYMIVLSGTYLCFDVAC